MPLLLDNFYNGYIDIKISEEKRPNREVKLKKHSCYNYINIQIIYT